MSIAEITKGLRRGFVVLLGASCLVLPACVGDEAPDNSFFDGDAEGEAVASVEQQLTSAACADPGTATILGTAGDDILYGTPGPDIIFGLGGNDLINGFDGDDILCGGAGYDNLIGGNGDDELDGGDDYNWLRGDAGDDTIYGGDDGNEAQGNDGEDIVHGGAGPDTLYGGDGNDVLRGAGGNDYMDGNADDDKLFGDDGNDHLYGSAGDDCLDGGAGNDRVHGEAGNDCLDGGAGIDQVACGDDADTYENGEWDFGGCETAGSCNCDVVCPCNAPNSFFEAFVTGDVTLTPGGNGFCAEHTNTSLVLVSGSSIAAGGEAGFSGSGNWACEGAGGYPGDTGFITGLTPEVSQYCASLVRDALVASGVNPASQCSPW
jgi:RTX calcium-binding nonapeptide repeat (4 copies)